MLRSTTVKSVTHVDTMTNVPNTALHSSSVRGGR